MTQLDVPELNLGPLPQFNLAPSAEELQADFRASERAYRQATDTGAVIQPGDTLERLTNGDKELMGRLQAGMGLKSMNSLPAGRSMVFDWGISASDAEASANSFYAVDGRNKALAAAPKGAVWSFREASEASIAQQKLDAARASTEYLANITDGRGMSAPDFAAIQAKEQSWAQGRRNLAFALGGPVKTGWAAGAALADAPPDVVDNLMQMQTGLAMVVGGGHQSITLHARDFFPRNGYSMQIGGGMTLNGMPPGANAAPSFTSYLSNSSAPELRQALAEQAAAIRASLPAELSGNVAYARIDVEGLPSTMRAYSGFQNGEQGFAPLPRGATVLEAISVSPAMRGGVVGGPNSFLRTVDGEFKILESVARSLGNNPAAAGRIDLYTELQACTSCGGAVMQFRQLYPGVQLNVFTGKR